MILTYEALTPDGRPYGALPGKRSPPRGWARGRVATTPVGSWSARSTPTPRTRLGPASWRPRSLGVDRELLVGDRLERAPVQVA